MYNCYIIGHPLNKPRSVSIWKKYFRQKKIKSNMKPVELKPENLSLFIKNIKQDRNFLATAVTSPLKIKAFKFINPGNLISNLAKSVNFIIKRNNKLFGYNTDVISLIEIIKRIKKKKKILIIGLGGVGLPLSKVLISAKSYTVSALTSKKNVNIKRLTLYKKINDIKDFDFDLVINCTPLGSDLKKNYIKKSPISEKFIKKYHKKRFKVLDIIYKPKVTKLQNICRKYDIKYFNGIEMNTLQANIALKLISNYLKK